MWVNVNAVVRVWDTTHLLGVGTTVHLLWYTNEFLFLITMRVQVKCKAARKGERIDTYAHVYRLALG